MPYWVKTAAEAYRHPKHLNARAEIGWAAFGVWSAGLGYCNEHQTDGFIPKSWAKIEQAEDSVPALLAAGLWHEDAERDGWQVHDFADFQPLKADIEAQIEARREAGKRGGKQKASNRLASAKQGASKVLDGRQGGALAKSYPVAVAVADTEAEGKRENAREREKEDREARNLRALTRPSGGGAA